MREADGLAMSTRNAYLKGAERTRARALFVGLQAARGRFREGTVEPAPLLGAVREALRAADVREDYVALVDPDTLVPLARAVPRARLLVAGFVGATRLIDNVELG